MREQRGYEIANAGNLTPKMPDGWIVPSQTGRGYYVVRRNRCTCPDWELHGEGHRCKHIHAVEIWMQRQTHPDGTVTEIVKVRERSYTQDWHNYVEARKHEKPLFDEFLHDLLLNVPDSMPQGAGRPSLPIRDRMFCTIKKVGHQLSQHRSWGYYEDAAGDGYIGHAPHVGVPSKLLLQKDITPVLHRLLSITALPLQSVETQFAVDSSGFGTDHLHQYQVERYGMRKMHHAWMKAHLLIGCKFNVVCEARITGEHEGSADYPQFIPLVQQAYRDGFNLQEVSADKAYSGTENIAICQAVGGTAYIQFKTNARASPRGSQVWNDAYHYFAYHKDEFLRHYHMRSNSETTFMAIKQKFNDNIKSKHFVSQTNELLCKLIAYNITVLIHVMYEAGIDPRAILRTGEVGSSIGNGGVQEGEHV